MNWLGLTLETHPVSKQVNGKVAADGLRRNDEGAGPFAPIESNVPDGSLSEDGSFSVRSDR